MQPEGGCVCVCVLCLYVCQVQPEGCMWCVCVFCVSMFRSRQQLPLGPAAGAGVGTGTGDTRNRYSAMNF